MSNSGLISILWIFTLLVLPSFMIAQSNEIQILVLYSLDSEKTEVEGYTNSLPVQISVQFTRINDINKENLNDYEFIVFLSSVDFSTSDTSENNIVNYIDNEAKILLVFTPYLNEFGGSLEDALGIDNVEDPIPDSTDSADWEITINQNLNGISANDRYDYTGKAAEIDVISGLSTIASLTNSPTQLDEIEELEFPLPIIVNATKPGAATVIFGGLDPLANFSPQILTLNQIPSLFENLIRPLLTVSIDNFISSNNISTDPNNTHEMSDDGIDNENQAIPDIVADFENTDPRIFLFLLIALALVFYRRLLQMISWISQKVIGFGLFVFGAFYNIQDRIIDHNDVLLNQSRVEIMDFLDYLEGYGAHLREIKSMTKMGTGSLLWHLQVLEDFNWISKFKINKFTVFVAIESESNFDPELKEVELKMYSKNTLPILQLLSSMSLTTEIDLAKIERETEIHRKSITRIIKKMDAFDLVEIIYDKPIKFRITDHEGLNYLLDSLERRNSYQPSVGGINVVSTD